MRFQFSPIGMVIVLSVAFALQWVQRVRADEDVSKRGDAIYQYREFYLRDKFVKSKSGVSKGRIARQLLTQANPEVLQVLRCDKDNGMALCAAWWRLNVQMSARMTGVDSSAAVVRIPDKFTREFLAFVEGRLQVPVPDGWNEIVRSARYTRWGAIRFPVEHRAWTARNAQKSMDGVNGIADLPSRLTAPRFEIDRKAKPPQLLFRGGSPFEGEDNTLEFTEKLNAIFSKSPDGGKMKDISGIAVGNTSVVVIERENGPDFGDIVCMTDKGGKPEVVWTNRMDAYWSEAFKGSEWFTELRTNKGNVYLFHGTHDSIGIEAFRLEDGKRLFSFNSRLPEPEE